MRTWWSLGLICLWPAVAPAGGGPQNVLVVIDEAEPDSVAIGEYYVQARDIPTCNVVRLNAPALNSFQQFLDNLAQPIKDQIVAEGLEDQIDYIVLTKGIPYRVPGGRDSVASVLFSEETDAWQGDCDLGDVALRNPYFRKAEYFDYNTQYVKGAIPLRNRRLVMMLSGFTVDGAMTNIDAGVASDETHPAGTVYMFSAPVSSNQHRLYPRHDQIPPIRAALTSLGIASQHFVVAREADADLFDAPDVMGYLTGATRVEVLSNTYLPGAVADHLTSFGGDLLDPTGQMSILEFTDAGVSGSSGTVTEPCNFAQKFTHALLYERYGVGFNLAEATWMSLAQPWQTIVVGDPLAQPWAVKPVVTIHTPSEGETTTSGSVELDVSAVHPRGDYLSRLDLFVDGKFVETLTDLGAPADNEVTLVANGTPVTYTTVGGEDSFDILDGLRTSAGGIPDVELYIPSATIGRSAYLQVRALTAGASGNGIPVSISADQGGGSELGVAVRITSDTLVGGMDAVPDDDVNAAKAQSHVFVTVGLPTLDTTTIVDLSALPDGPHELRVVAYQGDRVLTQGYAKRTVIKADTIPGDLDGDGEVTLVDFVTFARCFGALVSSPPAGCSPAEAEGSDLDGDGSVDLNDFVTFAANFGS